VSAPGSLASRWSGSSSAGRSGLGWVPPSGDCALSNRNFCPQPGHRTFSPVVGTATCWPQRGQVTVRSDTGGLSPQQGRGPRNKVILRLGAQCVKEIIGGGPGSGGSGGEGSDVFPELFEPPESGPTRGSHTSSATGPLPRHSSQSRASSLFASCEGPRCGGKNPRPLLNLSGILSPRRRHIACARHCWRSICEPPPEASGGRHWHNPQVAPPNWH